MSVEQADIMILFARKTNEARDKSERDSGDQKPLLACGNATLLQTAMLAVYATLGTGDMSCAAEGYDMMDVLYERLTGQRFHRSHGLSGAVHSWVSKRS